MLNLSKLDGIEKEIYFICETPKNVYDIIARLSEADIKVSYQVCCQNCAILTSKGFLRKVTTMNGRILYQSIIPEEENKEELEQEIDEDLKLLEESK